MQVSSLSGGSWSNPAAQSQQVAADQRASAKSNGPPTAAENRIADVEKSLETGDRDANGQYDGQPPPSAPQENTETNSLPNADHSLLDLPAYDDDGESTLDLRG